MAHPEFAYPWTNNCYFEIFPFRTCQRGTPPGVVSLTGFGRKTTIMAAG